MCRIKKLNDLSTTEFYEITKLRIDTFVVEQNRIYHELDEIDQEAFHVFFISELTNEVHAYARVFEKEDHVSFGRVVTSKKVRGKGYGLKLMKEIMTLCNDQWPSKQIEIEAQEQVIDFYEKFNFIKEGTPFIFEGSLHVAMRYRYENN